MIQQHHDKSPQMEGRRTAMIRDAPHTAELARRHNQPLLLWHNGQVVRILPGQ